ncbi:YkgJ family cysteine cluster protein [Nemorincola caseinilytica]|uniref:YkgJ family cysteine cluster protein n=1 Tax=Nemorincola caseinilytica TaxID=2054315 RepID=A0ABP8N4J5_9BACT
MQANWEKEAKEHQKAYKHMLEKGNRNKMLRELPRLHEEAFSKIDCLQCARCCKNHSPRFKQPDIKRIAKVLRIKEGDLVARYLRLDSDGDYVTQKSPCPFLADDNTCNIYDDRPSDCRRYPYTDEDVLLKRVQLTLKNATVCPATYAVLEELLKLQGH